MSKFSDYTEANIINTTLRGQASPTPTGCFIALFSADPTDANLTANEVGGTWTTYQRMDAAAGGSMDSGWHAPINGETKNAKVITFPANNAPSSVTITHMGIYDAPSGGNLLYHAELKDAKTLEPDDILSFGIDSIVVQID